MISGPQKLSVVLADDLTGAAEMAAFIGSVQQPALLTWKRGIPGEPNRAAIVLDTETRNRSDTDARRCIEEITNQPGFPAGSIYKKIDSTLRGPIRAELEALVTGSGAGAVGPVLLAPAYPQMKRTTAAGVQLADGVPVSEGPAGKDPLAPAATSDLRDLLPAGDVACLGAPEGSAQELALVLLRHRNSGRHVIVDAVREEQLELLGRALQRVPFPLVVGSGGLARYLWRSSAPAPSSVQPSAPGVELPILVVAGSLNPVVQEQLEQLQQSFTCHHLGHSLPVDPLPELPPEALILSTPYERTAPDAALDDLAGALEEVIRTARPGAVLVTGGETALHMLERLEATALEVTGELVSGVPIGRVVGGPHKGLTVATKAGGFGDRFLLQEAARRLLPTSRQEAKARS